MSTKYLDNTGLSYFWGKIKNYLIDNQSDWNEASTASPSYIKNKPAIPENTLFNLRDGSDIGSLRTLSSTVSGLYAFAGGAYTKASSDYQTVIGKYNIEDTDDTYAFIIGNGDANTANNAFTVDWTGKVTVNSLLVLAADYAEIYFRTTNGGSPSFIRAYDNSDHTSYGNNLVINPSGVLIIGGGESAYNIYANNINSAAGTGESAHIASDTSLYFYSNCNTIEERNMFYYSTSGNLINKNGGYYADSLTGVVGTTPSLQISGNGFFLRDSAGTNVGWFRSRYYTNGNTGVYVETGRSVNGTTVYNSLRLSLDASGNAIVAVAGTGAAASWRSAIGAVNKAGDTMTGSLVVEGTVPYYYSDSSSIDSTIGQTIPDSDTPIGGYDIRDKNDYVCGWFVTRKLTNDTVRSEFVARRKNAGGTAISNVLYVGVTAAGNRYVSVTDSSIWRDALGINGTQVTKTASSVNVTNGTDTNICNTGSLSAGTYVFFYRVSFGSNSTGRRAMFLSTDSSGSGYAEYSRVQVTPVGGSSATEIVGFAIATVSSATTWYLRAYQNSGSTLSCSGQIRYLKIHD